MLGTKLKRKLARHIEARLASVEQSLLNDDVCQALLLCMTLGDDVRTAPLREWARQELGGYEQGSAVPAYRTFDPIWCVNQSFVRSGYSVSNQVVCLDITELAKAQAALDAIFADSGSEPMSVSEPVAINWPLSGIDDFLASGKDSWDVMPPWGPSVVSRIYPNDGSFKGHIFLPISRTQIAGMRGAAQVAAMDFVSEARAQSRGRFDYESLQQAFTEVAATFGIIAKRIAAD